MHRKSRGIRCGSAALLMAGLVLAGAQGAANAATVYTAEGGDTFWKLSKTYGVPLDKLMAANPNVNPLNIYKGLKLVIPDAGSSVALIHTAGDGDTFWTLSKKYGVLLDKLMAANPNVDPLNIYKGLQLVIPDVDRQDPVSDSATLSTTDTATTGMTGTAGSAAATASDFVAGKAAEAPKIYKEAFQVKATAYTAAPEENGKWGAVDYFGNPLSLGTVAVDPDVIPLGSKLYITGYDYDGLPKGGMYAIARDTGGAIKGKRMDIFVPDSREKALAFGFQYIIVYVL